MNDRHDALLDDIHPIDAHAVNHKDADTPLPNPVAAYLARHADYAIDPSTASDSAL